MQAVADKSASAGIQFLSPAIMLSEISQNDTWVESTLSCNKVLQSTLVCLLSGTCEYQPWPNLFSLLSWLPPHSSPFYKIQSPCGTFVKHDPNNFYERKRLVFTAAKIRQDIFENV